MLENAVIITGCQHCFCSGCAGHWLASRSICPCCREPSTEADLKPARLQRELAGCAAVQCGHHEAGCTVTTTVAQLAKHQRECEYRPAVCRHAGCGFVSTAIEVGAHEIGCKWRVVTCKDCGLPSVGEVEAHSCLASIRQHVAETDARVHARAESKIAGLRRELAMTKFRLGAAETAQAMQTKALQDVSRLLQVLVPAPDQQPAVRFKLEGENEGEGEGEGVAATPTHPADRALLRPDEIAELVHRVQLRAHDPALQPTITLPENTMLYTVRQSAAHAGSNSTFAATERLALLVQLVHKAATARAGGIGVLIIANGTTEASGIVHDLPLKVAAAESQLGLGAKITPSMVFLDPRSGVATQRRQLEKCTPTALQPPSNAPGGWGDVDDAAAFAEPIAIDLLVTAGPLSADLTFANTPGQ